MGLPRPLSDAMDARPRPGLQVDAGSAVQSLGTRARRGGPHRVRARVSRTRSPHGVEDEHGSVVPARSCHGAARSAGCWITCVQLETTAALQSSTPVGPTLEDCAAGFATMTQGRDFGTADPPGLRGLLMDAGRVAQLERQGALQGGQLLEMLLAGARVLGGAYRGAEVPRGSEVLRRTRPGDRVLLARSRTSTDPHVVGASRHQRGDARDAFPKVAWSCRLAEHHGSG